MERYGLVTDCPKLSQTEFAAQLRAVTADTAPPCLPPLPSASSSFSTPSPAYRSTTNHRFAHLYDTC